MKDSNELDFSLDLSELEKIEEDELDWQPILLRLGVFIIPFLVFVWAGSSGLIALEATDWSGGCIAPLQKAKASASPALARTYLQEGLDCLNRVEFPKENFEYQNLQAISQSLENPQTLPTDLYPVFENTLERLRETSLAQLEVNHLQGARTAYFDQYFFPFFYIYLAIAPLAFLLLLDTGF